MAVNFLVYKMYIITREPVNHAGNPIFSGDRHQKDPGSMPVPVNSFQDPVLKNHSQKRAGGTAQCVSPEFKTLEPQKKKKNQNI
jgi:hypothetical protein